MKIQDIVRDRLFALTLASVFVAFSLLHFARSYDASGFTYAIVAEQGLRKAHESAHPLYVPTLRAAARLGAAAGLEPPFLVLFQLLSLAGAAAALVFLFLAAAKLSGDRWAAFGATLAFGLQHRFWYHSMQPGPYTLALGAAALSLRLLLSNGRDRWTGGLAAGLAVGAATAFDAINIALAPLLWLGPPRGAAWKKSFGWSLGACLAAYYLALPAGLKEASDGMQHSGQPSLLNGTPPWEVLRELAATAGRLWPESWWLLAWTPALWSAFKRDDSRARLAAAGAGVFLAGSLALFAVFSAGNGYLFALALPFPVLLAVLARGDRMRRALLAVTAAAVGIQTYAGVIRPGAKPGAEPARVELEFLGRHLAAKDILLVAGAPDWRVAYLRGGRFRFGRFDAGLDPGLYAPVRAEISAGILDAVESELKLGRKVWLAADRFYRPEDVLGSAAMDRYQRDILALLSKRFRLDRPRISPQGQWYVPILPRPVTHRI